MIEITITNDISLKKAQMRPVLHQKIKQSLIFANPKYTIAKKYGYSTHRLSPTIAYYTENEQYLRIPKGYIDTLINTLKNKNLNYRIINKTYESEKQSFSFIKELFPYQKKAIEAMKDIGMLVAPCGGGKTIIGIAAIAQRQQYTIILVHTKDLLEQWVDNLYEFLAVPKDQIGIIGAGKMKMRPITVGLIQTFSKRDIPDDYFGMVISDECHHLAANTFIIAMEKLNCKYQLGLTATPYRKDGLSMLIQYYIGEINYEITDQDLIEAKRRMRPTIKERMTEFSEEYNNDFTSLVHKIILDEERNKMIVNDIQKEVEDKNICLVLSSRVSHCVTLHRMLREKRIYSHQVDGGTTAERRKIILQEVKRGHVKVILATGNLAGEGLDLPILSRLFLVTPNAGGGRLIQFLGRISRIAKGKKDAIVYDYIDIKVGVCWGMWASRKNSVYNDFI